MDISGTPSNGGNFMRINIGHLRIIDSMQLMPCSLEQLVGNLDESKR